MGEVVVKKKKQNRAEAVIERYLAQKEELSGPVMERFVPWLAGDIHAEAKEAALTRFWDGIDEEADAAPYEALDRVEAKLGFDPRE